MNDELTTKVPSVQKTLNKVISEEFVAGMFYNGCLLAAINDVVRTNYEAFVKLFTEIADDELNDHLKMLKNWAVMNGYDVPFKFKDYEKYAEASTKQLNAIKKQKDVTYYIDEAIKSEQEAIAMYAEVMTDDNIPYDLYAIMQLNYYDELDHLDNLKFLKYAFENGAFVA